jgi:peptidoglycan/LPS O-acetylase OafA/YrhL
MVDSNDVYIFDPPMWSLFVEAWAMTLMPLIVWGGKTPLRAAATIALFVALSHFMANAIYGSFFVIGSFCTRFSFNSAFLNTRILQWLGKISYSLYLTHRMVLVICDLYIPSIAIYVQIPLCLVAAQATWAVIENPSIEASRLAAKRLYAGQNALRSACQRLFASRLRPG